ncbi:MAG: alanine racemase [Candidatus Omnitrophica bacterium]|nr:alanine racemase [Candidatus Omnitrophota bacterium]
MNDNIWIEISLKNISQNLKRVRAKIPASTKIMGVIKQNAYGHGLIKIAEVLEKEKVDFLGINSLNEARKMLAAGITTPLLILSNIILYENLAYYIKKKVRFTVMEESLLEHLNNSAKKCNIKALIHIKVDTGMSRLGLKYETAQSFIEKAYSLKNIKIEGLYSHFSSAESNVQFTNLQIKRFKALIERLKQKNIPIAILHLCNSAGLVNFKHAHLNMVRTGLLLYGAKPDPHLKINLKPALSLKSRIIHIKKIAKNSFVSYSNTFKTKKDTLAGVLACGYAYGYPWRLSGKAEALIKQRRCRVLGRVCMDHIVIDLSPLKGNVNIGDTAVLIGKSGSEEITARELAEKSATIPYEIFTGLASDIKRIYV